MTADVVVDLVIAVLLVVAAACAQRLVADLRTLRRATDRDPARRRPSVSVVVVAS